MALTSGWAALLAAWQELDWPAGWRAEIVENGITMTPPPGNSHNLIVDLVHRGLARVTPDEWGLYQKLGVSIPLRAKLFVPDLVDGHYQHLVRIPFGEKISLPEPFAIDLDTGGF